MSFDCDQYLKLCPDYLFSPGSTRTIQSALDCANARRTQNCDELRLGDWSAVRNARDAGGRGTVFVWWTVRIGELQHICGLLDM